MKKFLALLLLTAASLCAQETLDLGPNGKITLYLLGDWRTSISTIGRGLEFTVNAAKESTNAQLKIAVVAPERDEFDTKAKLKMRVEIDCEGFVPQSVEGRAYAKPLNVTTGYGFACDFTDPSLRGKPVKPGDYKVVTSGKIRLGPKLILEVFIGSEGFNTQAHQQLLGALEGMEYTPAR